MVFSVPWHTRSPLRVAVYLLSLSRNVLSTTASPRRLAQLCRQQTPASAIPVAHDDAYLHHETVRESSSLPVGRVRVRVRANIIGSWLLFISYPPLVPGAADPHCCSLWWVIKLGLDAVSHGEVPGRGGAGGGSSGSTDSKPILTITSLRDTPSL